MHSTVKEGLYSSGLLSNKLTSGCFVIKRQCDIEWYSKLSISDNSDSDAITLRHH